MAASMERERAAHNSALRIGIIGGSGLGNALERLMAGAIIERVDIPTPFGSPSDTIVLGSVAEVPVALLKRHGSGHQFHPGRVPYRANLFALKSIGCTHVVASGACGSLRETIRPGELVLCDQLIDRTLTRDRTFFDDAAVHVEFADPVCPVMRAWLMAAAARLPETVVHDGGTYVCIEGPQFSTRAEAAMHRSIGADVVGMTALPEARLAREAEMAYALLALPTDDDCWRPRPAGQEPASLLTEIMGNLDRAVAGALALIRMALDDVVELRTRRSPAHTALASAIWTERGRIPSAAVDRLAPIWSRRLR